jgi:hypothetical protein
MNALKSLAQNVKGKASVLSNGVTSTLDAIATSSPLKLAHSTPSGSNAAAQQRRRGRIGSDAKDARTATTSLASAEIFGHHGFANDLLAWALDTSTGLLATSSRSGIKLVGSTSVEVILELCCDATNSESQADPELSRPSTLIFASSDTLIGMSIFRKCIIISSIFIFCI